LSSVEKEGGMDGDGKREGWREGGMEGWMEGGVKGDERLCSFLLLISAFILPPSLPPSAYLPI